jgi:hypothetical protein
MQVENNLVTLRCVKEQGKLRIKVVSKGYSQDANCQFPKDIRLEGRTYSVPASNVKLAETKGKFFYRIGKKNIAILPTSQSVSISGDIEDQATLLKLKGMKIYEDEGQISDCCVCMASEKPLIIFAPCGHRTTCMACAIQLPKCPICRASIEHRVTKEQLQ